MVTGIRGFESEDFIESNEVHVYGQKATAFFKSMEPKPEGIEFVFHRPGDFIIIPLGEDELHRVTQECAILNMAPAKANSEGKIFIGETMDDEAIIKAIVGKKVTISLAYGGDGYLLAVGELGQEEYFHAEFAPKSEVAIRSTSIEEGGEMSASGLHWDGSPWGDYTTWSVDYDQFIENPLRDEEQIFFLDGRESNDERTWDRVMGLGNVNKYTMYADFEIEDHYEDDIGVIMQAAEDKGFAIKPVYMFSHSGDTIRTFPFYTPNGRVDYGLIGFVYIKDVDDFGDPKQTLFDTITDIDKWMNGQAYQIKMSWNEEEGSEDWDTMIDDFDTCVERSSEYALRALTGNGKVASV